MPRIAYSHLQGFKNFIDRGKSLHGKVYIKSCEINIKLKNGSFSQKHKKIDSNFT